MVGKVISAKVPEELEERISDFQQKGETRSEAVRRLMRRGLRDGPGNAMYAVIITFSIAWVLIALRFDSYTALYVESGIFHLLAVLWVGVPELRERVNSLRG
jgi:hypothetical protein